MSRADNNSFKIVIADDSADDRFLFKNAISLVPRLEVVAEVTNGTEAIAYLHGLGQFADRQRFPLPDMLLLDLKMPFKDGFDVLESMRSRSFKNMLVVVLTDSLRTDHVKRALDMGADYYLVKSRMHDDRHAMARAFEEYLTRVSRLAYLPTPAPTLQPPVPATREKSLATF